MVDNIAHHNNINHSSDKPQIAMVDNIANQVIYVVMVGYIVYHCYLRFVRGVVYVGMMGSTVPT
jgi:hypothetical protein